MKDNTTNFSKRTISSIASPRLILRRNVRRVVADGKKDIYLTRREFAILEHLVAHSGKVVDRNKIRKIIWGMSANTFSNVIDVHLKNIRKKLNNSKTKIIETVRGRGYRIRNSK